MTIYTSKKNLTKLISLKCISCGGNLEVNRDAVDLHDKTAVLRSGQLLKCPHCHTEHTAGIELPRPMIVNNIGGINFTAGNNITIKVKGNVIQGDKIVHHANTNKIDRVALFNIIEDHFSLEEIESLCFKCNVRSDNLKGRTASAKVRDLVIHLHRRKRLNELVAAAAEARPDLDWDVYEEDAPSSPKTTAPKVKIDQPNPKPQSPIEPPPANSESNSRFSLKSWFKKLFGG